VRREQAVVGDTPNFAARLQALAEPNTVVIADSTRRFLGNLFELEDLGPRDLKCTTGQARAWAALRASPMENRFEALQRDQPNSPRRAGRRNRIAAPTLVPHDS
jgi:class 3 adenylate cyclase